jgi:hypothetical protein
MNCLIKKLLVLLFLCLTAVTLFAEPQNTIDLSITIRTLDEAARTGRGLPAEGTPVILNGTVISRSVITPEPENFEGELIIASGEWLNSDDILVSQCIVVLSGPQFSETIPARRSRRVNPKEITMNSELLVYGYYLGTTRTDDGLKAVIQASGVRKLN